jgi:hypothetical protein
MSPFLGPTFLVAEPRSNRLYVGGRQGTIERFENDRNTGKKDLVLDLRGRCIGWNDCGLERFTPACVQRPREPL